MCDKTLLKFTINNNKEITMLKELGSMFNNEE
jgi:hypothetical protein